MAEIHEIGKNGELFAQQYLLKKGYKIIRTNYRFKNKEIDIIAESKELCVFIEIKTRTGFIHESPELAVNKKKQKFIIAAANYYLQTNRIELESRFDIIAIKNRNNRMEIKHIENAFQSGI